MNAIKKMLFAVAGIMLAASASRADVVGHISFDDFTINDSTFNLTTTNAPGENGVSIYSTTTKKFGAASAFFNPDPLAGNGNFTEDPGYNRTWFDIDNHALLNGNQLSFSVWIKPEDLWYLDANVDNQNRRIFQRSAWDTTFRLSSEYRSDDNGFRLRYNPKSTFIYPDSPPHELAPVGEWTMLTVTYDSDASQSQMFVNGNLVATGITGSGNTSENTIFGIFPPLPFPREIVVTNQDPIMVGGKPGSFNPGDYFRGYMDEIWIFNHALTPEEVQNLYQFNDINGIPEPSGFVLGLTGLVSLLVGRRRRRIVGG